MVNQGLRLIVIGRIGGKNWPQVRLAEDQHLIPNALDARYRSVVQQLVCYGYPGEIGRSRIRIEDAVACAARQWLADAGAANSLPQAGAAI
jgi:hypothetical protein